VTVGQVVAVVGALAVGAELGAHYPKAVHSSNKWVVDKARAFRAKKEAEAAAEQPVVEG
jgi:hypothetical protein